VIPRKPQIERMERLSVLCERLGQAVALDIEALERGAVREIRLPDPEVARLAALYTREIGALRAAGGAKGAPATLVQRLKEHAGKLKTLLEQHGRLAHRMRHASEGLIQAIAEEIEAARKRTAPYSGNARGPKGPSGAIVYNDLI